MKIVNATPHTVTILNEDNEVVKSFPASELQGRLKMETTDEGDLCGIPLTKTRFLEPSELPEIVETYYIVSQMYKDALPHRSDLLVPANVVREKGVIIGCKSLGV